MEITNIKKTALLALSLAFIPLTGLSADAHVSSQAHQASVTDLAPLFTSGTNDNAVFSSAFDGFLIKWTEDGLGEHYQITDMPIRMIARSPNGTDIAVYESDGASINRVSVWNWKTHSRKYAFRFTDSVTSLSYSAKGTYLICGTASVSGTVFINTTNGSVISRKLSEATGVVTMSYTSDTENSLVLYAPTAGTLSYYNLRNGTVKAKFDTLTQLTQPCMFNNLVFVAGIKNGSLHIIQATSGKTVASFPVKNAVLINMPYSKDLYYLSVENRVLQLYKVQNDRNKTVIQPQLVSSYSKLKQNEILQSAALTGRTVYAGTSMGNIYSFELSSAENSASGEVVAVSSEPQPLIPLTDNMYDRIYDVACVGERFYFLTPNAIFLSSFDNGVVDKKGVNPGYTNMLPYGENLILWSKDTRKPVQLFDVAAGTLTSLFTPGSSLQQLRIFEDSLVDIEGNASVNRYHLTEKRLEQLYLGAGLQDAVLTSANDLYVAKSSATNPNVPLLYVNCETKETVPVQTLKGNIAYSLAFDGNKNASMLYGILVSTGTNKSLKTTVFALNLSTKMISNYLPLNEEDNDAFTFLSWPQLYTNLGKNQVRSYNLQTRRDFTYKRSASLPLKVVRNEERLVVLNRDGSISWYNPTLSGVLADWYLTT
ncbi:MAG: WD40 repeat domain-containing protein, partial [Treponema sp.]|nr:WD40 repeat domain-containing protein [Treponema sp.]